MSHDEGEVFIGNRNEWGQDQPFGISSSDRRQHLYILGKTGSGKTTLLRNLILQDIEAGRGVGLIDPHGDLAESLLDQIPPWRTDDVVYFNPADVEHPIGFNLVRARESPHLIASGIVGACKSIWRDSWGPRLEYILYASVAALIESEHTSLMGIGRMLVDPEYRRWVVKQVKDPIVREYWLHEYESYGKQFMQEAIAPVQNKIGALFMAAPLRNILGQVRNRVDARFMMDNRRIFIANLSKARLGEDKSGLLGSLLMTQFQWAAMGRAGVPEEERKDFHLYVDEFHQFITDSFASALSEARKYRLNLTLSHQYLGQLREEIREAVFGNVGSMVSFRLGYPDAKVLAGEFGNEYDPRQFTDLANHEVCARLIIHGQAGMPFLGQTYPSGGRAYGRKDVIIRRSREKYCVPKAVVEDKIRRWMK
jgi:energy-coupling factor transporter ATP-binding protein EcfA2